MEVAFIITVMSKVGIIKDFGLMLIEVYWIIGYVNDRHDVNDT